MLVQIGKLPCLSLLKQGSKNANPWSSLVEGGEGLAQGVSCCVYENTK